MLILHKFFLMGLIEASIIINLLFLYQIFIIINLILNP